LFAGDEHWKRSLEAERLALVHAMPWNPRGFSYARL
jgi:hypothetical protein